MNALTLGLTFLFSVFSTTVMTYITLATPIGPWMGPTLALMSVGLLRLRMHLLQQKTVLLAVIGGSLGGIIATAFSFSFPTFYFLSAQEYHAFFASPLRATALLALFSLCAGLVAYGLLFFVHQELLDRKDLSFPVGKLVYETIASTKRTSTIYQLCASFVATFFYGLLLIYAVIKGFIVRTAIKILPAYSLGILTMPAITVDFSLLPMLWSIGFIAGHLITVPLLAGTIARIFVADTLYKLFFTHLSSSEFLFAFCSGIVLSGAFETILHTPFKMYKFFTASEKTISPLSFTTYVSYLKNPWLLIGAGGFYGFFFYAFKFTAASQLYLVALTLLCTYQIVVIAGKIGMALLGRFATFVMIPGLLLFGFDFLQITLVSTFVELAGGVGTEMMFGLKAAQLAQLRKKDVFTVQLFGLVVSSCVVALVLWFLSTHFQLGSEQLFAQRAQGRALLIKATSFDYTVLALGALFGWMLKKVKLNPMLVLGGLLMNISLTFGLVLGGLSTFLINDKEQFEPLCSGMYAANSLYMIVQALLA